MADTYTPNLNLTKPEVGASRDTWGGKTNGDWDIVDAIFAAAGSGTSVGLNVGSGKTLTVAGTQNVTGTFKTDTVSEYTAAAGVTVDGVLLKDSGAVLGAGAVGTPSVTTTGDTNTGLYFPAADTLSATTGGTERLRIDSSGNVGIGTSSPNQKLQVVGSNGTGFAGATLQNSNANVGIAGIQFSSDTTYSKAAIGQLRENPNGTGPLVFYVDTATDAADWSTGDEKMRITAAGDVGIGTSSPGVKLDISGGVIRNTIAAAGLLQVATESANSITYQVGSDGSALYVGTNSNHALRFTTNNAERARITNDGQFFVDTTTNDTSSRISTRATSAVINGVGVYCTTTAATGAMVFFNSNGQVGTIQVTGSATAYITSSDYRLKENVAPITNGLTTIASLKPVTYDWKNDASKGEGFIAHELQSVIPAAVSGEKDAINKDGSINPQGVDYSKIVVHLVAAIQELKAENDDLKARLTALEAK